MHWKNLISGARSSMALYALLDTFNYFIQRPTLQNINHSCVRLAWCKSQVWVTTASVSQPQFRTIRTTCVICLFCALSTSPLCHSLAFNFLFLSWSWTDKETQHYGKCTASHIRHLFDVELCVSLECKNHSTVSKHNSDKQVAQCECINITWSRRRCSGLTMLFSYAVLVDGAPRLKAFSLPTPSLVLDEVRLSDTVTVVFPSQSTSGGKRTAQSSWGSEGDSLGGGGEGGERKFY